MCGRYAASKNPDDLVEEFEVEARPEESLAPDYNVAHRRNVDWDACEERAAALYESLRTGLPA